mgnify:CR=1 FL=1
MEIVKYVIMAIYAIVCVSLIVLATKSKEDGGASGTIVGASSNNFYEKNKGKTAEGRMKRATITLMIVFAVLTIALGIIFVV